MTTPQNDTHQKQLDESYLSQLQYLLEYAQRNSTNAALAVSFQQQADQAAISVMLSSIQSTNQNPLKLKLVTKIFIDCIEVINSLGSENEITEQSYTDTLGSISHMMTLCDDHAKQYDRMPAIIEIATDTIIKHRLHFEAVPSLLLAAKEAYQHIPFQHWQAIQPMIDAFQASNLLSKDTLSELNDWLKAIRETKPPVRYIIDALNMVCEIPGAEVNNHTAFFNAIKQRSEGYVCRSYHLSKLTCSPDSCDITDHSFIYLNTPIDIGSGAYKRCTATYSCTTNQLWVRYKPDDKKRYKDRQLRALKTELDELRRNLVTHQRRLGLASGQELVIPLPDIPDKKKDGAPMTKRKEGRFLVRQGKTLHDLKSAPSEDEITDMAIQLSDGLLTMKWPHRDLNLRNVIRWSIDDRIVCAPIDLGCNTPAQDPTSSYECTSATELLARFISECANLREEHTAHSYYLSALFNSALQPWPYGSHFSTEIAITKQLHQLPEFKQIVTTLVKQHIEGRTGEHKAQANKVLSLLQKPPKERTLEDDSTVLLAAYFLLANTKGIRSSVYQGTLSDSFKLVFEYCQQTFERIQQVALPDTADRWRNDQPIASTAKATVYALGLVLYDIGCTAERCPGLYPIVQQMLSLKLSERPTLQSAKQAMLDLQAKKRQPKQAKSEPASGAAQDRDDSRRPSMS